MMRARYSIAIALLFCSLHASAAFAQAERRAYAFGTIGYGTFGDDEGGLGNGAVYGGGGGFEISDRFAFEGAITRTTHAQLTSPSFEGEPLIVTGRLLYRFGDAASRARAFVGAGAGYLRYEGTRGDTSYPAGPLGPPQRSFEDWRVSGVALEFGAGVDVKLGSVVFIRPEGWLVTSRPARVRPAPEPPYFMPRFALSVGARF